MDLPYDGEAGEINKINSSDNSNTPNKAIQPTACSVG